jgi:hypothetical protein
MYIFFALVPYLDFLLLHNPKAEPNERGNFISQEIVKEKNSQV